MGGLLIVFGTRPEVIKLWPVVEALRLIEAPFRTCSTGQHQELLDQAIAATGMTPDIKLQLKGRGQSLNHLMAAMLPALSDVIESERPDRVIVQGDTTSALTAAIAAHHLGISVAHVEAGLRTGDTRRPWPEEFNRRAISAVADIHFAPTERAARALSAEGHPPERIIITGNTSIDALVAMRNRIARDESLIETAQPVLARAAGRRLLLVTCHRRENLETGVDELAAGLRALASRSDVYIVCSLHPNPAVGPSLTRALAGLSNIELLPPLRYPCFVALLMASYCVLTDSGGVQEEAAALGKPILVLRDRTERVEGIDADSARLIGIRAQRVVSETCRLLDCSDTLSRMSRPLNLYGDGRAAGRIAAHLVGAPSPYR